MADEAGQIRTDVRDAQGEAIRRTALAQVRQFGDPALRLEAREVDRFDDDLRRLVERMTSLMLDANGVGLAGNQVGVLQRVVVLQPDRDGEPIALVNPRLASSGDELAVDEEGCLSLQGVIVPVERPTTVTIEAQDPAGKPFTLELSDLGARVAQHELDHLDGVLILDRTTPEARREAMAVLRPRAVLA